MSNHAPFLTASRVDLFQTCAYSALLPTTYEQSDAADRGTETHAQVLRPGCLPQVALDWFGGREPRYEVALGWRPPTSDECTASAYFGDNLDRWYSPPGPDWLCGTADAVQVAGGVLSVADLKTGYGQVRGSLPSP